MNKYKIHVYMLKEDTQDSDRYIYIRREDLNTGKFDFLRNGPTTWPEAIVKTCVQVGVDANLYWITEENADMNYWDKAELIPEDDW